MATVIVAIFDLGSSIPNYNRISERPLQFLRTGYYHRSYGYLDVRTTYGFWWSDSASSATYGRYLRSWTGNVLAQDSASSGHGFALGCVAQKQVQPINNWGEMSDKNG